MGPGNLDFFVPQMARAYRLDAMSQGPKIFDFHGTNPLPLGQVMDAAVQGRINHRCIYAPMIYRWMLIEPRTVATSALTARTFIRY